MFGFLCGFVGHTPMRFDGLVGEIGRYQRGDVPGESFAILRFCGRCNALYVEPCSAPVVDADLRIATIKDVNRICDSSRAAAASPSPEDKP